MKTSATALSVRRQAYDLLDDLDVWYDQLRMAESDWEYAQPAYKNDLAIRLGEVERIVDSIERELEETVSQAVSLICAAYSSGLFRTMQDAAWSVDLQLFYADRTLSYMVERDLERRA